MTAMTDFKDRTMNYRLLLGALGALAVSALATGQANATTASGSFQVSLTIQATCTVQSTATLAFGTQTAIASALNTTSAIGVVCTNATPYTIGLSAGTGTGATVAARILTSGSNTIPYSIYQDSGHLTVWGVTGAAAESATGTGAVQTYTAYGQIAPVAAPVAGVYADTVAVTVTY
jgi:spore coat protein U-like protein